jgi:hypothetical protein
MKSKKITKGGVLLFTEITAVHSGNSLKLMNTFCGQHSNY